RGVLGGGRGHPFPAAPAALRLDHTGAAAGERRRGLRAAALLGGRERRADARQGQRDQRRARALVARRPHPAGGPGALLRHFGGAPPRRPRRGHRGAQRLPGGGGRPRPRHPRGGGPESRRAGRRASRHRRHYHPRRRPAGAHPGCDGPDGAVAVRGGTGRREAGVTRKRQRVEKTPRLPDSGLSEDILALWQDGGGGPAAATPAPAAVALGSERLYELADRLAARSADAEQAPREEPETWVAVEVAGEVYALPVASVEEVLRVSGITRLPYAPAPVRGITQQRGRVLTVVDLRVR